MYARMLDIYSMNYVNKVLLLSELSNHEPMNYFLPNAELNKKLPVESDLKEELKNIKTKHAIIAI